MKVNVTPIVAPDVGDIQKDDMYSKEQKKSLVEAYGEVYKCMVDDNRVESFRITSTCWVIAVLNDIGVS